MQVLPLTSPLSDYGDDLVFHSARLISHKLAAFMAPAAAAKLAAVDACGADETKHRRAIIGADSTAAGLRSEAELYCVGFGKFLLGHVNQNRQDPRWLKYYGAAPSDIVGGDRDDLDKWLTGVVEATATEADLEIAAQAQPAAALAAAWTAARHGQVQAAEANRQHGETVRVPLRQSVNALREKHWLALRQIANDNGLGKRWPESFFRKVGKGKPGGDPK